MKKRIALVLSLVLGITMLTGCGNKDNKKESSGQVAVEKNDSSTDKVSDKDEDNKEEGKSEENKADEENSDKSKEDKDENKDGSAASSLENKSSNEETKSPAKENSSSSNNNTPSTPPSNNTEKPAPKPELAAQYVTLSITCNTLLDNMDKVDDSKKGIIPSNGVILGEQKVEIKEGESVFEVLLRVTREKRIHLDFVESPVYNSAYIRGIQNLYEFDGGDLSGWMYSVNGVFPNKGCSRINVKNGDRIEWKYTCDLGKDL